MWECLHFGVGSDKIFPGVLKLIDIMAKISLFSFSLFLGAVLAVALQACYGILKVPEGSWLCRTCALGVQPKCLLCPKKGGAMKPTRSGTKWVHVSCALWIPEVGVVLGSSLALEVVACSWEWGRGREPFINGRPCS